MPSRAHAPRKARDRQADKTPGSMRLRRQRFTKNGPLFTGNDNLIKQQEKIKKEQGSHLEKYTFLKISDNYRTKMSADDLLDPQFDKRKSGRYTFFCEALQFKAAK